MIDNTLASVPQVVTVIPTLHSLTTSARLARSANSASVSRKVGQQVTKKYLIEGIKIYLRL